MVAVSESAEAGFHINRRGGNSFRGLEERARGVAEARASRTGGELRQVTVLTEVYYGRRGRRRVVGSEDRLVHPLKLVNRIGAFESGGLVKEQSKTVFTPNIPKLMAPWLPGPAGHMTVLDRGDTACTARRRHDELAGANRRTAADGVRLASNEEYR